MLARLGSGWCRLLRGGRSMSRHLHVVRPLALASVLLAAGAGATRAQEADHARLALPPMPQHTIVAPQVAAELAATAGCDPSWASTFGTFPGVDSSIQALTVFDDGSGPALYVGGSFSSAHGLDGTRGIARWDGTQWSSVGGGLDGGARCFLVYDDGLGGGPALYVGGGFTMAGGVAAEGIARWDGSDWSALGGGIGTIPNHAVNALAEFDDGTGPALYACGTFDLAGGQPVN